MIDDAPSGTRRTNMLKRLSIYLSFVRFSHSVFALPFAFAGALLAARHTPLRWPTIVWILHRDGCGPQRRDGVQPTGRRAVRSRSIRERQTARSRAER